MHIKNGRWFRDCVAFLLGKDMKDIYYYWFFFVDAYTILSTHRVHGTSAAWCFCGSIVQWYTGTGVSLPWPSPLKLLCCRCFLTVRHVRDLSVPCHWCEMLQGMGYPPRFWTYVFLFQIIVLLYEPFTFLPFFSHYPDNQQSYEAPHASAASIIFHVQSLLDVFTACVRSPSTLLGLLYFRKWRVGILNYGSPSFFFQTPIISCSIIREIISKIWRGKCFLSVNTVGFIYVLLIPSMNLVGVVSC